MVSPKKAKPSQSVTITAKPDEGYQVGKVTVTDKDGNTLTLLDTIATDDHILEDIDLRMKVRQLYDAVKTRLSPREREIILLRYGLTGQRSLVQREVAKKLNISRSYVSRLEKKALQKLRKAFDE